MSGERFPGLSSRGVTRAAPFDSRPPSPPYIHIPPIGQVGTVNSLSIVPTYENIDSQMLTKDDLNVITQGKIQMATYMSQDWRYESRRQAQPILDFLYLGPSSVAKDREFLQQEGITMLLAARDSRLANARLMSVERTAQELGLEADYIDVSDRQELIRAFPLAVKKINDHLIRQYRSQAVQVSPPEATGLSSNPVPENQMMINSANFRKGKVLVFCETGNDRSAAVVAAYMMTMFNSDLVKTLQFINLKRFCANFDDETKFLLRSYEDIVQARRAVNGNGYQMNSTITRSNPPAKRQISDTVDEEDDVTDVSQTGIQLDKDRYMGRDPFAPFVDGDIPMA
jgi:hypothetical protein